MDFAFILQTNFLYELDEPISGRSPDSGSSPHCPFPPDRVVRQRLPFTVAGPSGTYTRFPILPYGHLKVAFIELSEYRLNEFQSIVKPICNVRYGCNVVLHI
jgi:hypothetical protein